MAFACIAAMAATTRASHLAAQLLGHPTASRRQYETKWEYVRNNPLRHGLVTAVDDWPYAGELNVFEWE